LEPGEANQHELRLHINRVPLKSAHDAVSFWFEQRDPKVSAEQGPDRLHVHFGGEMNSRFPRSAPAFVTVSGRIIKLLTVQETLDEEHVQMM
jgi:hypothetical protein